MDKTEKDKQLIKESFEHWDRLILLDISEDNTEGPYDKDCPLCQEYSISTGCGCDGCPIYIKTEAFGCLDTPYGDARYIWNSCDPDQNEEWQQAATAMRDWLKELYEDYTNPST